MISLPQFTTDMRARLVRARASLTAAASLIDRALEHDEAGEAKAAAGGLAFAFGAIDEAVSHMPARELVSAVAQKA